jgi:hypothetical protein
MHRLIEHYAWPADERVLNKCNDNSHSIIDDEAVAGKFLVSFPNCYSLAGGGKEAGEKNIGANHMKRRLLPIL